MNILFSKHFKKSLFIENRVIYNSIESHGLSESNKEILSDKSLDVSGIGNTVNIINQKADDEIDKISNGESNKEIVDSLNGIKKQMKENSDVLNDNLKEGMKLLGSLFKLLTAVISKNDKKSDKLKKAMKDKNIKKIAEGNDVGLSTLLSKILDINISSKNSLKPFVENFDLSKDDYDHKSWSELNKDVLSNFGESAVKNLNDDNSISLMKVFQTKIGIEDPNGKFGPESGSVLKGLIFKHSSDSDLFGEGEFSIEKSRSKEGFNKVDIVKEEDDSYSISIDKGEKSSSGESNIKTIKFNKKPTKKEIKDSIENFK